MAKKLGRKNKKSQFYYGMITVEYFPFRNAAKDIGAFSLAQQLEEDTGRQEARNMMSYANRVEYTESMKFDWVKDMPEDIQAEVSGIQEWWDLIEAGANPAEAYLFYLNNVPNYLTNDYNESFLNAHRIWKPTVEQTPLDESEREALEESDPNS